MKLKKLIYSLLNGFNSKEEEKALELLKSLTKETEMFKDFPNLYHTTKYNIETRVTNYDNPPALLLSRNPFCYFDIPSIKKEKDFLIMNFPYFCDDSFKILKDKNIVFNNSSKHHILIENKDKITGYQVMWDKKYEIIKLISKESSFSYKNLLEDLQFFQEKLTETNNFYETIVFQNIRREEDRNNPIDEKTFFKRGYLKKKGYEISSTYIFDLVSQNKENKEFLILSMLSCRFFFLEDFISAFKENNVEIKKQDIINFLEYYQELFKLNHIKEGFDIENCKEQIINHLNKTDVSNIISNYFLFFELENNLNKKNLLNNRRNKI